MTDLCGMVVEQILLERQIGSGGVAQVYYGRNYQTGEAVAVKICHPHRATDPAFAASFLQEYELNHQLDVHPHILRISSRGEWDIAQFDSSLPYLITPFIAGGSVARLRQQYAKQKRAIPPQASIGLALRVAAALFHAHQAGVLHLDIKPENLLLRYEGNLASVVVADFGTAATLLGDNAVQTLIGTPAYMAPEQFAGLPVGPYSDQYALAVVLYELLTGKRPFAGDGLAIFQQQHTPPDGSALPEGLTAVFQQALAFAPDDRFDTVDQFAQALRQWQQTAVVTLGRVPRAGQTAETRLQAESWLPPISQTPYIDYQQRWVSGQYRFFVAHQDGHIQTRSIGINTRVIEIGRQPFTNDTWPNREVEQIVLPDNHISLQHATLERAGDGWQVLDKGSRNGTFLNGEQLLVNQPRYWRGRTPLRIGPYLLVWESQSNYGLSAEQALSAYSRDEARWNRLLEAREFWQRPQSEQIVALALTAGSAVRVAPGETAVLNATLTSQSAIIERVELRVEGIPPDWYTITEGDFAVVADTPVVTNVQFHPPPPHAPAGLHPGELILFAPLRFETVSRQPFQLEVLPLETELVDLHPKQLRPGQEAWISLWNTGNVDAAFWVLARDPADAMRFDPAEAQVPVQAQERRQHLIAVTPLERRPFLPPGKQLPYEVLVGRTQTTLKPINGQLHLPPVFPGWLLIALPLLILLLYLVVPPIVSRQVVKREIRQQAALLETEAQATIIAADMTKTLSDDLLAAAPPEAEATLAPPMATVAANRAAAEANLAAAEAQADQAAAMDEMADEIAPIGGAIPPASPPTAIMLDNNEVAEDAAGGALIGLLTAQDTDQNEMHLFTLVAGDGDTDNGLVAIVGNQLQLFGALDFETQPELSIRVQARDSRGELFAQRLTLLVTDANEPFTAVSLSNDTVIENELSANIGELTAVDDPDTSDTHTFTLIEDPSDKLEISGSSLRVKTGESLNYEQWPDGLEISVQAEDGDGHQINQLLTIQITDKNDLPTVAGFGLTVNEDETLTIDNQLFFNAFTDQDGDRLVEVKITQLPAVGQFKVDDDFVFADQELSAVQLTKLSFVPARNFNGTLSFQWTGSDGEGFATQPAMATISVVPVADSASFVPDTNEIQIEEDSPRQSINWAADIRNPDGDTWDVRFVICNAYSQSLFGTQPRISAGGNVVMTPARDQYGSTRLDVVLTDVSTIAAAGETAVCATTSPDSVTLTILPINDPPRVTATISQTYVVSNTMAIFADLTLTDADNIPTRNLTYAGGSIDIQLTGEISETLWFTATNGLSLAGNTINYENNEVGTLENNGSTRVRIVDLTNRATLPVLEQVLKSINLNTQVANSVTIRLWINDGGNVDKDNRAENDEIVLTIE